MPSKNDQEYQPFQPVVAKEASIRYCVAFDEKMQIFPQSSDDDDLVVGIAAFTDSSHGASSSSRWIHECLGRARLSYRRETARDWGNLLFLFTNEYKERFSELADEWRRSQGVTSNLTQIVMNPAYQQIIGMGEIAVPFIFSELERKPDHWFWALISITGVDPVSDENRGNIRKMAEEWLHWGKKHGYYW